MMYAARDASLLTNHSLQPPSNQYFPLDPDQSFESLFPPFCSPDTLPGCTFELSIPFPPFPESPLAKSSMSLVSSAPANDPAPVPPPPPPPDCPSSASLGLDPSPDCVTCSFLWVEDPDIVGIEAGCVVDGLNAFGLDDEDEGIVGRLFPENMEDDRSVRVLVWALWISVEWSSGLMGRRCRWKVQIVR